MSFEEIVTILAQEPWCLSRKKVRKLDRLWVYRMLHPRDPETGALVQAGTNGAAHPKNWKESVKEAARAKGQSEREADELVKAFEERRGTLRTRAAEVKARIDAERGKPRPRRTKGGAGAGNQPLGTA